MFYQRFIKLCENTGTKPSPVAKHLGLATGSPTAWKNGTIPDRETLVKIADYFDCSIDYLLGRSDNPQAHKSQNTYMIHNRDTVVNGTQANVVSGEMLDKDTLEIAGMIQGLPLVKRAEAILAIEKIRKSS